MWYWFCKDCQLCQLITLLLLLLCLPGRDRPPITGTDEPAESGMTLHCRIAVSCHLCIYLLFSVSLLRDAMRSQWSNKPPSLLKWVGGEFYSCTWEAQNSYWRYCSHVVESMWCREWWVTCLSIHLSVYASGVLWPGLPTLLLGVLTVWSRGCGYWLMLQCNIMCCNVRILHFAKSMRKISRNAA